MIRRTSRIWLWAFVLFLGGITLSASAAETNAPTTNPSQQQIDEQIYILRHALITVRIPQWMSAIRTLSEVGKPAVPALCAELDQAKSDTEIRALEFTLRVIGDPRAVPALIRAIPKSRSNTSDFGLTVDDQQLFQFMREHNTEMERSRPPNPRFAPDITFNRAVTLVNAALEEITSNELSPKPPGGAALQNAWQKFWDEKKDFFVTPAELATVENFKRAGDPVEDAGIARWGALFPAGPNVKLGPVHEVTALSTNIPGKENIYLAKSCLDLDHTRELSQYEGEHLGDSPAMQHWWEDADISANVYNSGIEGSATYRSVVEGRDLLTWQVDNSLWDQLPQQLETQKRIDPGSQGPYTEFLTDPRKPYNPADIPATFLFITRRDTRGIMQIEKQLDDFAGLQVRYRLFEIAGVKAPRPKLPEAKFRDVTFAAPQEVQLFIPGSGKPTAISLATGETLVLPEDVRASTQPSQFNEMMTWAKDKHMNFLVMEVSSRQGPMGVAYGLESQTTRIYEIDSAAWSTLTAPQADEIAEREDPAISRDAAQTRGFVMPEFIRMREESPGAGIVVTDSGNEAVVLVSPVEGKPDQVSMKYKTIQVPQTKAATLPGGN